MLARQFPVMSWIGILNPKHAILTVKQLVPKSNAQIYMYVYKYIYIHPFLDRLKKNLNCTPEVNNLKLWEPKVDFKSINQDLRLGQVLNKH